MVKQQKQFLTKSNQIMSDNEYFSGIETKNVSVQYVAYSWK